MTGGGQQATAYPGDYNMEQIVAKIRKGPTKEIWIILTDFTGEARLSIREYYYDASAQEFRPTKKGLMVPLESIPELRDALDKLIGKIEVGTVASFSWTDQGEVRVGVNRYQGHVYDEIRLFVPSKASEEEWNPTGKGVTFNRSALPQVLEAIDRAEDAAADIS